MNEVLALVAGLLAVTVAAVGLMSLGTFLIVRGVIRRTRRGTTIATSMLQLRSAALPVGTRGEIGRARVRLRTNLNHTERVLGSQVVSGTGPNPFIDLLVPMKRAAIQLDAHLALVEREPDAAMRRALLSNLLLRTDQVITDAATLRQAAYGLADEVHTEAVEPLIADVRDRIGGLLLAMRDLRTVR